MNGLAKNYSLHVFIATAVASAMILMTSNSVADAVKPNEGANEEPIVKGAQKLLPPPGPYGLVSAKAKKIAEYGSQMTSPPAPSAPTMPVVQQRVDGSQDELSKPQNLTGSGIAQSPPKLSVVAPSSPAVVKSEETRDKQGAVITKPVFKSVKPSMTQPLAPVKPKNGMAPVANDTPVLMPQKIAVNPPTLGQAPGAMVVQKNPQGMMPQLMFPVPPPQPLAQNFQGQMPVFRGHPRNMMPAPQIKQYRYIPLPVYKSDNGNGFQLPAFGGNAPVPGFWMPQMNNRK